MHPQRPSSFNHRIELLSTGRSYHFIDQLPDGYDRVRHPTLLCVHGFPDLWYGWRYQIGPWVRRGFRVIAPDMLGYGASSKPIDPDEYSTKKVCADLDALLDKLGIEKVVGIGHDWGSFIIGRFALWHPDRLHALIMMSVPYNPPSREYIPIERVAQMAPNAGYQVYFASEKTNLELLAYLDKFINITFSLHKSDVDFVSLGAMEKLVLNTPMDKFQTFLNDTEFTYYRSQLSQGMFGPLNYYRTSKIRHEEELAAQLPATLRPNVPYLFMWGTNDKTITTSVIDKARKFIPRYQDIAFEGRGHWLMIESGDEVTETIVNWIEGLTPSKAML